MHKVSNVLAERFSQDPLETYFRKQHPRGAGKDNLPLYDFDYDNTYQNQMAFKQIATGSVKDENIYFESDRTSSMLEKNANKTILAIFKSFKQPSDTYLSNLTRKVS